MDALVGNPGAGRPVWTHEALLVGLQQTLRGCAEAGGLLITLLCPPRLLAHGLEGRNHPGDGEPFHRPPVRLPVPRGCRAEGQVLWAPRPVTAAPRKGLTVPGAAVPGCTLRAHLRRRQRQLQIRL